MAGLKEVTVVLALHAFFVVSVCIASIDDTVSIMNTDSMPILPQTIDGSTCPPGYFHCNTTTQCVAQRLNCDGTADCDDGSDEWECDDDVDSKFWDHFFRKQPFGRSDDIPIGVCHWESSNLSCPCRGNEMLCRFQNFNAVPSNLPRSGMAMLDLTGNSFPVITKDFFEDLPQVETLVLKFCSIKLIDRDAFQRISSIFLETLYLDENRLESLPEKLFPANNYLRILILSGNRVNVLHPHNFDNLEMLQELDLRENRIETFTEDVFRPLENLETLYLNGNKIRIIEPGMIPVLGHLHSLSLSHNEIRQIRLGALRLPQLEFLFLSENHIFELQSRSFCGVSRLKGLNLDNNRIYEIEDGAFACVENLTSLLLTGNPFTSLRQPVLRNLTNLNYIYFSWFHLCRAALHVRVCEPKGDGISSTLHLLDNTVLRGSVWVMSAIAIFGNIIVLFGRYLHKSRNHVEHSLYLRHLAASDLIMGIYLAAIATADIKFRGEYILYEEEWRQSMACSICGFLNTLSCQSSTLLLTLVTWDRLISVTRPLQPRTTGKAMIALRLFILWGISFALAAAPLTDTNYFGSHFYGNNGVCLSLHIHDPYAKGWEYSAGLFILINTFSLVFIIFSYMKMLQAIGGSTDAMRSTLSGRENVVARRFAIIVGTDCTCWLPIIIVKLAALGGVQISPALYAWLAVLVLPVNSALNPVLYTLTTTSFKQQLRKYFQALPSCSTNGDPRSQTAYESGLSISLGHFGNGSGRKRLLHRRISFV